MAGGKHGPNRLSSYLAIHDTIMRQFLGRDFVTSEDLSFSDLGNSVFLMEGTIHCLDDLRIVVSKHLRIVGGNSADPDVCTVAYSYSAILGNRGSIFRYDSPHPDHNNFHHKHQYAVLDGDVRGTVMTIVPQDAWPTLGEVMQELSDWYYGHLQRRGR